MTIKQQFVCQSCGKVHGRHYIKKTGLLVPIIPCKFCSRKTIQLIKEVINE